MAQIEHRNQETNEYTGARAYTAEVTRRLAMMKVARDERAAIVCAHEAIRRARGGRR